MNYKYEYTDSVSRQAVIDAHKDLVLIEDDTITEGNFLIFSDVKPLENQLSDLNTTINQVLLKQEGVI